MGSARWLIPIVLGFFTWLLIFVIAINASVALITSFLRASVGFLIVGGIAFGTLFYLEKSIGQLFESVKTADTNNLNVEGEIKGGLLDVKDESKASFIPGQINPDLQELLASEPEKAAAIIRRMTLEDEQ